MATRLPRGVALSAPSESAMEHAWAPEESASMPEEDTVETLAMLAEDKKDDAEKELQASPPPATSKTAASAVGANDVEVMSKFAAFRWIHGKHLPKRTSYVSVLLHVWCGFHQNE